MSDFAFPHRVAGLRARLDEIDALIVSLPENVRYVTGFSGSSGLVVLTKTQAVFFTDGRYKLQAEREVPGFEQVVLPAGSILLIAAGEWLRERSDVSVIGFEADHLPYSAFLTLEQATEGKTRTPRSGDVEAIRAIKDASEVAKIRAACQLADACFEHLCSFIKPGLTEARVAWELESFFRTNGAQKLSFDPIVGSGPNSALIHGRASERVIGASGGPEFVLLDFGCVLDGYCSDITRTVVVGSEPTEKMRHIYDAVLAAQLAALAAIKPGVEGKSVDTLAREQLKAAGYGEMPHGLGHGLGRVVHDLPLPTFSPKATVTLAAGMVATVEPGVYLEGLGGVRIEDDVLVTEAGCERLTLASKELQILGN
jgi:Xaa-Pro aminopeptidase